MVGAALLLLTGCKRDYFDPQKVKEILELSFHNDSVDPSHTWQLTSDWVVRVEAAVEGVSSVMVLTENPYESTKSEILAQHDNVEENSTVVLNYTTPATQTEVYVAAVTKSGQYKVTAIKPGTYSVSFATASTITGSKLSIPTEHQMFYCFCNSYPQPSATWGYNDLVMRLKKRIVDSKTLHIDITLAALGSQMQMAGALRLSGIMYDAIEKVTVTPENGFLRNEYKELTRTIIKDNDLLLKGRDGTAVINLFDDAHAAFYLRKDNTGAYNRYLFNVSHGNTSTSYEYSPVTVGYDITFKQSGMADGIGFAQLDPFIAYYYNSAVWEVHKYAYKLDEALFDYYSGNPADYNNGFTWALEIPYTWFRYPLQGQSMGSYKNGAVFGAYQRPNHSFGQWGTDKSKCLDWYLYPTTSMVY